MLENKCDSSHHEDFPNTIDGKEVAEDVEVFPLECLWVFNSLLKIKKGVIKDSANHLLYVWNWGN